MERPCKITTLILLVGWLYVLLGLEQWRIRLGRHKEVCHDTAIDGERLTLLILEYSCAGLYIHV